MSEENRPLEGEGPTDSAPESSTDAAISPSTTDQPDSAEPQAPEKTKMPPKPGDGPISLERIRQLRKSQQQTAPRLAPNPGSSQKSSTKSEKAGKGGPKSPGPDADAKATQAPGSSAPNFEVGVVKTPEPVGVAPKIEVPSRRAPLSKDLEDELAAALEGGGDLDSLLVGDSMVQVGHMLEEGQRIQGKVVKAQGEFIFLRLGGPHEGLLPAIHFEEIPAVGTQLEVVVRGYLQEEGLYELVIPGSAVQVSDWSDLNEGEVIEVVITGSNTGGLECKAGSIQGFIPASQAAEYRVDDLAEMVGQKVLCVITEANPRRGNLVLSRRAVLEREKKEKREERLAAIQVGDAVDGTVTKLMDFGAFVDIGGLDGLLHISQLSWDRIEHPREILEEGQKIQVRIDKIDPQSGKIGLSYRSLQEHPWADSDQKFPVGSIVRGSITRLAEFGAFVRVATGVEGLVHVSELAHHRVHRVSNVVEEGQEVDVKILSVDEESQRMSLSLKGAQAAPEPTDAEKEAAASEEPPAKPVLPKHQGPLKGGTGRGGGGEKFGLKW